VGKPGGRHERGTIVAFTAKYAKNCTAALILIFCFLVSIPIALAGTSEIVATDSFQVRAQFEVVHENVSETVTFSSDPGFPATVRAVFRDPSMLMSDANRVELVSMRLRGKSKLVGTIRISAGRELGQPSSTGKILSPVIIRQGALVPPYGASINLLYSIELLDFGIRITRTVPISLLLARENTSAVVQLGGPGRPPVPIPPVAVLFGAILAFGDNDPHIRDQATNVACKILQDENQRIHDQVISEQGILAFAVFMIDQPSTGEVRKKELQQESPIYTALRDAAASGPELEVRLRAQDVLNRCGDEDP
jgi:hypothetical protein